MRAKGYKCSNVKCDRCVGHSMCGEFGDAALNCVDRIIARHTNADRIRAMSDEELADVVANGVGCVLKAPHCMDVDCTHCILKWLKQPFEEE